MCNMEKAVFDQLVIEFNELNDKISKLKDFILTKIFLLHNCVQWKHISLFYQLD